MLLTGEQGFTDFIRRLTAMVLMGNTDAHLKNWAVIYPDRVTPRLAPIYDFHSTTIYHRHAPVALVLAGEEMPGRITRDHFKRLAAASEFDADRAVAVVDETVTRMRETWAHVRTAGGTFPALVEHIDRRLTSLALAIGA